MEAMYHTSLLSNSGWLTPESKGSSIWTKEENKRFESALAVYDDKTPNRWLQVAAIIPGKSVWDVMRHYEELEDDVNSIEAGLVPIPGYCSNPAEFDVWSDNGRLEASRKKSYAARFHYHERKKGVPWTEDEHRRFLLGLKKYGKGDWRNISRNFVITKTPTQVASHAQKYFLRQLPSVKDKRRPSIHDITTASLTEDVQFGDKPHSSRDQSSPQPQSLVFSSTESDLGKVSPIKLQGKFYTHVYHGAYLLRDNR